MTRVRFEFGCPGHEEHLCYLVNLRRHQRDPADYYRRVTGARFLCKKCGRVAAEKKYLCRPVKL